MYTTDLLDVFLVGRGLSRIIGSCVTNGTFTTSIYGETITAAFENGIPKTVYGAIVVTEEMLK